MISLDDILGTRAGDVAIDQISNSIGADQGMTTSAVKVAVPMILAGLAKNAAEPTGAEKLNSALEKDHSGGLLDTLSSFLGGETEQTRETDGGGILSHILGEKQGPAANEISKKSGLDKGQVAKLLMILAPIVMAYVGKQKRENEVDSGGISDLLGGLIGKNDDSESSSDSIWDMATSFLDQDDDDSITDDLASMASKYFG